jgi:hypothetical protein
MELTENRDVFSVRRWKDQLTILSSNPDKLDIDTWIEFLYECCNLFKVMGSAMSMAFSGMIKILDLIVILDITTKAAVIRDNKEFYAKEQGMTGASLQEIIDHEIKTQVHLLNGDNNAKKLDKSKK